MPLQQGIIIRISSLITVLRSRLGSPQIGPLAGTSLCSQWHRHCTSDEPRPANKMPSGGEEAEEIRNEILHRRGREVILHRQTHKLALAADVDHGFLSRLTTGFTEEDLSGLCGKAAYLAALEGRREVTLTDFSSALSEIVLHGAIPLLTEPDERRRVAAHEAGHALVAWRTPGAPTIRRVSLFFPWQSKAVSDPQSHTKRMASLDVLLGSSMAETLLCDEVKPDGSADLYAAGQLARLVIQKARTDGKEGTGPGSEAQVDQAVRALVQQRLRVVRSLLQDSSSELRQMVILLEDDEVLDEKALIDILGRQDV